MADKAAFQVIVLVSLDSVFLFYFILFIPIYWRCQRLGVSLGFRFNACLYFLLKKKRKGKAAKTQDLKCGLWTSFGNKHARQTRLIIDLLKRARQEDLVKIA